MSMNRKLARSAVAVSLMALATACGGASTNNLAASANMQSPATNGMAEAMPSGPFSQAEMQMHERMMAARGANASETWLKKMIEHHRGAVAMSQVLVDQGGEPRFVEMARMTVEKQRREIGDLERMLAGGVDGNAGEADPFSRVEQDMHRQMMAAGGDSISEAWARKMIAHHQGAVTMSETLVRQGGNPAVVAMARRIAQAQRREIAHLEAMLRGEAMPADRPAPAATPNDAPRERAAPKAAPARPAPAPAQRAPTPPAAAPTQPPAQAPTCAPEHRAMGHC